MAKAHTCLYFVIFLYIYFVIFLYLYSGNVHHGEWCVAKPATKNKKLKEIIDFACSKVDCAAISNGGASEGRHSWNCNFEGSGIIAITDPSTGNCKYQFKK
ncbi:hypothetical protein N665_1155s0017 [Sinapis alba]|nr:hypothetical protein N665_1155s0017 [Sinapis alba]